MLKYGMVGGGPGSFIGDAHRKAINLAREQRRINGKGLLALIVASILPLIVLAGGFFFFVFGGMYTFK